MSFDYNTERNKLTLPEYGRNVYKMVEHAMQIEDREQRNRAARTIVSVMGTLNPQLKDPVDNNHKLWDHLAIMSDFKLDIDSPHNPPDMSVIRSKPGQVSYQSNHIRFKHYGKNLELFIKKAIATENEQERNASIRVIANHMKKQYLTWSRESATDEQIFSDLAELSEGKLMPEKDLKLTETKDLLHRNHSNTNNNNKKKRKNFRK